jgi:hypothetical protein
MTTKLSQYTDSDELTHDQAVRVIANLLSGRPYEQRLSADDLAARTPVKATTVRDLIPEVRAEYGVCVYSRGSQGYWDRTDEEVDRLLEHLEGKRDKLDRRIEEVREAAGRGVDA